MYVSDGARRLLLAGERERFLNEEWPQILAVINRLGFLLAGIVRANTGAHPPGTAASRQRRQRRMRPNMAALIEARDLTKKYGAHIALDRANLTIEAGRIVGLIGPNGAGKTTALRAILGLTTYEGQLTVLGREPFRDRTALMSEACFIADVAVLPSWLRVDQAIDFVAGVHPRFRRDRAVGAAGQDPDHRQAGACASCPRA